MAKKLSPEASRMLQSALGAAQKAADVAFDDYLSDWHAGAASYVPQCVIDAAREAYVAHGGWGEIFVRGHGNVTHPVCSVSVHRAG